MRPASADGVKDLYDKIGLRVKDLRLSLKMNQTELAEAMTNYFVSHDLGNEVFTKNSIERFENQRKHFDKIEYIIALAEILKTDCHFLLTGIRPENASIASNLGLTQASLSALADSSTHWNSIINFFIENDCKDLCSAIREYLDPIELSVFSMDEAQTMLSKLLDSAFDNGEMSEIEKVALQLLITQNLNLHKNKAQKLMIIQEFLSRTDAELERKRGLNNGKAGQRRRNNQET